MKENIRTVGIIAIGNEVLDGLVLDTNSNWMEIRLVKLGLHVKRLVSVRDDLDEIEQALKFVGKVCDVIITSGGLGPTHDDMTLKAVANSLNRRIVENPDALAIVKRQYQILFERGIVNSPDMSKARIKMAQIPEESIPLDNRVGGAPGVMIHEENSTIFCLPGVPSELKFIFENSIMPWVQERIKNRFYEQVVEFQMHDESVFAPAIDTVMNACPGVYIKSLPKTYGTSKTLRVWISMSGSTLDEAQNHVKNAVKKLESVTGLKAQGIQE
ncbi:MAG: competence/damage-inducible protein A [Candidatus Odinarchaeota archaeon]